MAPRTYTNFDLLFEQSEDGRLRARVAASPVGARPAIDFALPFDDVALENLLLKLDPGRSGTRRVSGSPQVEAGRQLGSALFDAVFTGAVADAWSRSRDAAGEAGQGLRLRLHLGHTPAIAWLPWELLYDQRSKIFLAQSERTPVVRFLDVPHPQRPLQLSGPLQILTVISAPTDLSDLDVETEWAHVQGALDRKIQTGRVEVHRLPAPTVLELGRWLRRNPVHVLHFIGHGAYDDRIGDGVLYFCDEYGRSTPVSASTLGPYIHDHDPLRLIVLNACRSSGVEAAGSFGGMAQGLIQQHGCAVVAMQFPITDRAATSFTAEFYGAIADGFPVEQAVAYTRKVLLAGFGAEWATPTVFLHADNGQIFDPAPPTEAIEIEAPEETAAEEAGPVRSTIGHEPAIDHQPSPAAQPIPDAPAPRGPSAERGHTLANFPPPAVNTRRADSYRNRAPTPSFDAIPRGATPEPTRRTTGWIPWVLAGAAVVAGIVYWALQGDDPGVEEAGDQGLPSAATQPAGVPVRAADPSTYVSARAVSLPPTIDGHDDEWTDRDEYATEHLVASALDSPDFRAYWRLRWDAEHYYVFIEVVDPTLTQRHAGQPDQLWRGDSAHFEFGPLFAEVRTDALEVEDVHVLLGPTEQGEVITALNEASGTGFASGQAIPGVRAAMATWADGYSIEAAIPWSALGVDEVFTGAAFVTNLNASNAIPSGDHIGALATMLSNNEQRTSNDVSTRHTWAVVELID